VAGGGARGGSSEHGGEPAPFIKFEFFFFFSFLEKFKNLKKVLPHGINYLKWGNLFNV